LEEITLENIEDDIITLGFTARLLLSNLDKDQIIERASESLGNFGKSNRIGLFIRDQEDHLMCVGGLVENSAQRRSFEVDIENTPYGKVMQDKHPASFPIVHDGDMPVPVLENGTPGRKCLCVPLIAANNVAIGVVTFDHPEHFSLPSISMQSLLLALTMVAVALETTRLFQNAVYDGLTGLFIRRYLDRRLAEEENRIKRHGGNLAILMTDIDFFKRVNDTYGHQQGDTVLKQVADIIKISLRKDLDAPCRYGGEEFVVIMPDTDLAGALIVAERIRHSVQTYSFPWPDGDFQVTLSGGVAFMDQNSPVSGAELLKRADDALYRAKSNGRNQIQVHI
jgi:diguanylate cyclase (GGDEF)-like protein